MKKNFTEHYNKEFRAFALSKIFESSDKSTHIHILRREGELKQFSDMLKFFNDKVEVIVYPAWDCLPYSNISPRKEIISKRYSALRALEGVGKYNKIFLLSIDSVIQKTVPIQEVLEKSFSLKINQKVILSNLIEWLEKMGYSRQTNVYSIGEYALRGGILDVFVPEIKYPIRLDFFGTKLEKIRTFDPSSQRSNGSIKDVNIFPVSEIILDEEAINIFRQNYRRTIGTVKTDDRVYNSISEKILVEGIEHWLPLFNPKLVPLFSVLNRASLSYDSDLQVMIENKWEQIVESRSFDLKTVSNNPNKLSLLSPLRIICHPLNLLKLLVFMILRKLISFLQKK